MRKHTSFYCVVLAASMLLAGCPQSRTKLPSAPLRPAATPLPAPAQIAPPDQSAFTNFPRTVRFQWAPIAQAATYAIEIDCYHCCAQDKWCSDVNAASYVVPDLTAPAYTFDFWGNQPGRWRVWAIDARSQPGTKSGWSGFSFAAARANAATEPQDSTRPQAIYSPPAQYTDAARRAKINGDVVLDGLITPEGSVETYAW